MRKILSLLAVCFAVIVFVCPDAGAAMAEDGEVPDNSDITVERYAEGYPHWQNVRVSLEFPRVVKAGGSFSIKITTVNDSGKMICWGTSGTNKGKGVKISDIKKQGDDSVSLYNPYMIETMDYRSDHMVPWALRSNIWDYSAKVWFYHGPADNGFTKAPAGVYDIYLNNGEVYRGAITVT